MGRIQTALSRNHGFDLGVSQHILYGHMERASLHLPDLAVYSPARHYPAHVGLPAWVVLLWAAIWCHCWQLAWLDRSLRDLRHLSFIYCGVGTGSALTVCLKLPLDLAEVFITEIPHTPKFVSGAQDHAG